MPQVIDELITVLDFETNRENRKNFEEYKDAIAQIGDAAMEAANKIRGFATAFINSTREIGSKIGEMYEWAEANAVSADSLQRLGYVAEQFGGDIDEIKGDMAAFAMQAKAQGKSLEEVFIDISSSVQGLDKAQQRMALSGLVSSEALIKAMQAGPDEIRRLSRQAYVATDEQAKASLDFVKSWRYLVTTVQAMVSSAVANIMPVVKSLIEMVQRFFDENKEAIVSGIISFFKAFAIIVGSLAKAFLMLVGPVAQVIAWLNELTDGIAGTVVAFTAIILATAAWVLLLSTKLILSLRAFKKELPDIIKDTWKLYLYIRRLTTAMLSNAKAHAIPAWMHFKTAIASASAAVTKFTTSVIVSIKALWVNFKTAIIGAYTAVANFIGGVIASTAALWHKVAAVVADTAAQWALNAAVYAFPAMWIVAAIVAVAGALYLLVKNIDTVKASWNAMSKGLVEGFKASKTWAADGVSKVFAKVRTFVAEAKNTFLILKDAIGEAWLKPMEDIVDKTTAFLAKLRKAIDNFRSSIDKALDSLSSNIRIIIGKFQPGQQGGQQMMLQPAMAGVPGATSYVHSRRQNIFNNDQRKWYITTTNNVSGVQDPGKEAQKLSKIPDFIKSGMGRK